MAAKGIRLPNPLWERIEAEAASLRMTRSDYLRRKLGTLFSVESNVMKSHSHVSKSIIDDDSVPLDFTGDPDGNE